MSLGTRGGSLLLRNSRLQTGCACCCALGVQCNQWPLSCETRLATSTVSVFGATFSPSTYPFDAGLNWQTSVTGREILLVNGLWWRNIGSGGTIRVPVGWSAGQPTSPFTECAFRYLVRSNSIASTGNIAVEYAAGTPRLTASQLAQLGIFATRRADWQGYGTQLSPAFSSIGDNSWQIEAPLFIGPSSQTPVGVEAFVFHDGNPLP